MKERVHSNDKATANLASSQPSTKNLDTLPHQQTHPATLIQRAKLNPRSLPPSDVLQLQRLIGNQAVERQLAGTVQRQADSEILSGMAMDDVKALNPASKPVAARRSPVPDLLDGQRRVGRGLVDRTRNDRNAAISTIQRYIAEAEARKLFSNLQKFATLSEEDRQTIRKMGIDDKIIHTAIMKMLTTLASLTLGKDTDTLAVAHLPMELTLGWPGGNQLALSLISPPGSGFHNRTFGVDRIVTFQPGKKPTLYESRIDIAEKYQGGGAGAAIVRSGLEFATDLGIQTISIEASDKGRYAWASIGFIPNPGEWNKIADGMLEAIEGYRPKEWDIQAAKPVIEPVTKEIESLSATLEKNLRSAIKSGKAPETHEFAKLDERILDAVMVYLKPIFKPIGEKLDEEADKNPIEVFGQKELNEPQMENWGNLFSADGLATYLAKQALHQLLGTPFLGNLQVAFAPVAKLSGTTLNIPGTNGKEGVSLKGTGLPIPVRERLIEILSPSTRAKHSLADVVDLANNLKGAHAEAAAFIRELVARSATWKGTADLTDKATQQRLKKSTGWTGPKG